MSIKSDVNYGKEYLYLSVIKRCLTCLHEGQHFAASMTVQLHISICDLCEHGL
jgi:hypothetical protein